MDYNPFIPPGYYDRSPRPPRRGTPSGFGFTVLIVIVLILASRVCDLGGETRATPTPVFLPAPTTWWPTPSYQPWPTPTE